MTSLTLRARVALLVAVVVGLAVGLASGAAYLTLRYELLHQIDAFLVDRAEAAADSPLSEPGLLSRVPSSALGATDVRVALVRSDGTVFLTSGDSIVPVGLPEVQVAGAVLGRSLRTAETGGTSYRIVAVPVSPGLALVLARSLDESQRVLGRLAVVLLGVGLLGIAVAASTGLAVARTGLAPVERLTAAAEHVARTEELQPIEVRSGAKTDEVSRLALAFNAMLAALADSRDRQRRLVADAGHELRTPLTSLRTNLDLLGQSEAAGGLPRAERSDLLADVRAEVRELAGLVTDLVELAREDAAPGPPTRVDFAEVVARAVERARRRAGSAQLAVDLQPWQLDGDARLLERAVTNLLDNAGKWSPPGGVISVILREGVLRVTDQGPGIADADLPHVFDRFYRSADARPMPGSGLGLAIVRQVADQHGGRVAAASGADGGAEVSLTLPGVAADPQPTVGADSADSQPRTASSNRDRHQLPH